MSNIREQAIFEAHVHCINPSLRDIYLHSFYTEVSEGEPGVEYRQSTTFIKNLHLLDQAPYGPILVHMHTIGGSWDDGMAVYNAITFAKSKVTILGYAQASSMSGIMLQSPKLRLLMPDCHFMMHHGWAGSYEEHPFALRNEATRQMKICERMLQVFANRAITGEFFKKKADPQKAAYSFFKKKIEKNVDWILEAEEAVYYGLADGVIGSKKYPDVHGLRK